MSQSARNYPLAPDCHYRIALVVEYDGSAYHGWQAQKKPAVATVQQALEHAVSSVAARPVSLYCAGRTDAGVHATGQVVHFDSPVDRGEKAWTMGVNSNLPRSIRVTFARAVGNEFHARHTALFRRYEYWIENTSIASALHHGRLTWFRPELDHLAMHKEAQSLLGEQDFTSFQAAACQSRTPMRNVQAIAVDRIGTRIRITVQANAFLLHMVRNIVGALLEVGTGAASSGYIRQLLESRDRKLAPPTAKPDGLYLVAVGYPQGLNIGPEEDGSSQSPLF